MTQRPWRTTKNWRPLVNDRIGANKTREEAYTCFLYSGTGRIRGYLEAVLLAETTIPEFVRATPYESFVVAAPPVSAIPLSAADLEATFFRTNAIATTPEMDYHRVSSAMAAHEDENGKEKEEQEDDDDDEIVLAPSLANLSLRLA